MEEKLKSLIQACGEYVNAGFVEALRAGVENPVVFLVHMDDPRATEIVKNMVREGEQGPTDEAFAVGWLDRDTAVKLVDDQGAKDALSYPPIEGLFFVVVMANGWTNVSMVQRPTSP